MDLHWQRLGAGPASGIAVHCSLAHGRAWAGVAAALEGRLALEVCDMPGHGRSPDWSEAAGDYQGLVAAALIARAEALAEATGGGARPLIGHSFGGTAALRAALARPDLVSHLVLIEPVMFAAALAADPGAEPRMQALFAPFQRAWEAGDRTGAARAFTAIWGGGPPWEALPEAQRAALAQRIHLIPAGNPGIVADVGGILAPGRLEGFDRPVTLIEGAGSPAIVGEIQRALAARLPVVTRHVVAGAGHMVPLSHPAEVAALIARGA